MRIDKWTWGARIPATWASRSGNLFLCISASLGEGAGQGIRCWTDSPGRIGRAPRGPTYSSRGEAGENWICRPESW